MNYSVEKTFLFEAAHRLGCGYKGKCTNNHGHSWVVTVTLTGKDLNNQEMLMDFADLKKIKTWIDDVFDHSTILVKGDPFINYLKENGYKVYVTERNPTSEHLCYLIFKKAQELFESDKIFVKRVLVDETCTSRAEISI